MVQGRGQTGLRIVKGPEVLFELEIGKEDPDPDADGGAVLLAPRVQNRAPHSGDQEHRVEVRVRLPSPAAAADPAPEGGEAQAAIAEHVTLERRALGSS